MRVDKEIAQIIGELEYEIGKHTYNPNSYNGWTGEEGASFTYPVKYCLNKSDMEKHILSSTREIQYLDPDCIKTMRFTFGSNHLYIGDGLVDVLNYLERRYGLDFNKLESKRVAKLKNKLEKSITKLDSGKSLIIESGKHIVGIDIPEGDFVVESVEKGPYSYVSLTIYDAEGNDIFHQFSNEEIHASFEDGYMVRSFSRYAIKRV